MALRMTSAGQGSMHVTQSIMTQINSVSGAVLTSEDRIDVGIGETARLIATTLDARRAVELPAYSIQTALDHMVEALTSQCASRRHIAAAHLEFGKTAAKLGFSPESVGDLWPCPQFPAPQNVEKKVVRIAAAA